MQSKIRENRWKPHNSEENRRKSMKIDENQQNPLENKRNWWKQLKIVENQRNTKENTRKSMKNIHLQGRLSIFESQPSRWAIRDPWFLNFLIFKQVCCLQRLQTHQISMKNTRNHNRGNASQHFQELWIPAQVEISTKGRGIILRSFWVPTEVVTGVHFGRRDPGWEIKKLRFETLSFL